MRTSRDVVRPFVALLVVVAAVTLASNVAAYRIATTSANAPFQTELVLDPVVIDGCDAVELVPASGGAATRWGLEDDRDGEWERDGRSHENEWYEREREDSVSRTVTDCQAPSPVSDGASTSADSTRRGRNTTGGRPVVTTTRAS